MCLACLWDASGRMIRAGFEHDCEMIWVLVKMIVGLSWDVFSMLVGCFRDVFKMIVGRFGGVF